MTRRHPEPIVYGHGPAYLLIIPGWFSDHRLFDELVGLLDPTRFTIARFDIRGYGWSHDIGGRYDLAEIADDAIAVADELGWPHFSVIGHSMGGKVAQRLAIAYPERVRAVAAITPVPAVPLQLDDGAKAFFARAAADDEVAKAIVAQSVGSSLSAQRVGAIVDETRRTARPEAFANYAKSFIEDDLSAGADTLSVPLLILFGAEDRGVDHIFLDPLYRALYPAARIELLSGSGHYPMIDGPVVLAKRLHDFLGEVA